MVSSSSLHVIILLLCTSQATTFNINTTTSGPTLINEFLSVTIDAGLAGHWYAFNFQSTLVNTLAKGLSPLYFRYGGTSQDETTYNTNGNVTRTSPYADNVLNMTEFSQLAEFAKRNGWKFIFGLNAQERFKNDTWNPENSEQLMNNIITSGKDNLVIGYELGNEPDLYYKDGDRGFVNVTAEQLSKDFITLYNLINKVYKNANYKPFIWGCDIADQFPYLQTFLSHVNTPQLNGATWHHYYGNSKEWTLADFISIAHMDSLIPKLNESMSIIQKYLGKNSFDILGETSSSYGGGTANLSASFVAGFLWLDKLGLASAFGLHLVARQDFWGGNYALIGIGKDFDPNPDYWSSYLFKNLIGNKVLYVDNEFESGRTIRVYSFCTRTKSEGSIFDYNKGSVTTMILNVQNNTVSVDLKLIGNNELEVNAAMSYDEYLLSSYPGILNSRDIFLNGKIIKMINDETFPELNAVHATFGSSVNMKALSYGFVVILNANVSVCM